MKRNRTLKLLLLVVALILCLSLTACSTTLGENTEEYFSQIKVKINILSNNSTSNDTADEDDDTTALDAPGDFTVGEDGSYSFTSVENADYYLLYMYDTSSDSTTYTYLSSSIEEDGSGTYTGYLSDSITYAFGTYRVEALAYPSVTDDEHKTSEAASAEMVVTGEVSEPEVSFVWDCFSSELDVLLTNVSDYQYTAYPTLMEVTLTNASDASDTVTSTLEGVSSSASTCAVTGVTLESTYSVSVSISWDEDLVTNSSISVEAGSVTVSATANAASDGYTYSTGIYSYMDYPLMVYNFDVVNGGDLGSWEIVSSGSAWGASASTATYVLYTATPAETVSGDLYTFDFVAVNDDGSSLRSSSWGSLDEVAGQLHIYEDGTFLMECESYFIYTDQISMANQYHDASSVEGIWTENEDGTINLAFNLSSETDLGHDE